MTIWPASNVICVCKASSRLSPRHSLNPANAADIHRQKKFWCCRYAIGHAERPLLKSKVGWLDILANDTHQFYYANNTGGPSIKVCWTPHKVLGTKIHFWTDCPVVSAQNSLHTYNIISKWKLIVTHIYTTLIVQKEYTLGHEKPSSRDVDISTKRICRLQIWFGEVWTCI
jgi:hypothetical protein